MILYFINEVNGMGINNKLYKNEDWFFIIVNDNGDYTYNLIPINLEYRIPVKTYFNESKLYNTNIKALETNNPIEIDFDFSDVKKCPIDDYDSIIEELNGFFTLRYSDYPFIFTENGLFFIKKKLLIPYENIEFAVYSKAKNYFELTLNFINKKYFTDFDVTEMSQGLLFWIKKYDLIVKDLDILFEKQYPATTKTKFRMLEKTITKLDKIVAFVFLIIPFFLGIPSFFINSKEDPWWAGLIITGVLFSIEFSSFFYFLSRLLVISDVGITLIIRSGLKRRIFIPYNNFQKIIVNGKKIEIIGKYSIIEFNYKSKIIEQLKKYIDLKDN